MASQLALQKLEQQSEDSYYSNPVPWQYCSDTKIPVRLYGNAKVRFTTKDDGEHHEQDHGIAQTWGPPEQDIVKLGVKNQRIAAAFLRLPNVASLRLFWMQRSVKPLLDSITNAAKHDYYIETDKLLKYRGIGLDVSTTLSIMASKKGPDMERLHWLAIMPDDFQWTKENWEAFNHCCEPPIPRKHFSVWQLIGVIIPMVRRNPKQFPRSQISLTKRPPRIDDDDIVAAVICIRSYLIAKNKSKRKDWITTCDKQPSQTIYFLRSDAQPSQYWLRKDSSQSEDVRAAEMLREENEHAAGSGEHCIAHFSVHEQTPVDTTLYAEALAALYTIDENLFIDHTKTMRIQKESLIAIYKLLIRRFDVKFRSLKGALVLDSYNDIERGIRTFETLYQMAKLNQEKDCVGGHRPALINVPENVLETWQMVWSSWFSTKIKLFLCQGETGSVDRQSGFGAFFIKPTSLVDELLMPKGRLHPSNPEAQFSAVLISHATLPQITLITLTDHHSLQKRVRESAVSIKHSKTLTFPLKPLPSYQHDLRHLTNDLPQLTWTLIEKDFPSEEMRLRYRTIQICLEFLTKRGTRLSNQNSDVRNQSKGIYLDRTAHPSNNSKKRFPIQNSEEATSLLAGQFGLLVIDEAHMISAGRLKELQACSFLDAPFNIIMTSMPSESFRNGCVLFEKLLFRGSMGGVH